jgi:hypothetical protein
MSGEVAGLRASVGGFLVGDRRAAVTTVLHPMSAACVRGCRARAADGHAFRFELHEGGVPARRWTLAGRPVMTKTILTKTPELLECGCNRSVWLVQFARRMRARYQRRPGDQSSPKVALRIRNMPRDTLLPGPDLNASARPSAIDAMITTRAIPEGTTKVSRKSVKIRPSTILG